MKREEVKSKFIRSIGYDPATQILEVELAGGRLYKYLDVPAEVHAQLVSAESIGRTFNSIKGAFACVRVEEGVESRDLLPDDTVKE